MRSPSSTLIAQLALVASLVAAGCDSRPVGGQGAVESDFYAVVGQSIVRSSNGRSWALMHRDSETLHALALGAGRLVAVGLGGRVVVSRDGSHFEALSSPTSVDLYDVAFDGARFVAVGYDWTDGGALLTSVDGERWRLARQPDRRPLGVRCVGARCFVSSGHFGDLPDTYLSELVGESLEPRGRASWERSEDELLRQALGVSGDSVVQFNDGEVLARAMPSAAQGSAQSVFRVGDAYVALGQRGVALTSPDARRWTPIALSDASSAADRGALDFVAAAASPELVLLGASAGRVVLSSDLRAWRKVSAAAEATVRSIVFVP